MKLIVLFIWTFTVYILGRMNGYNEGYYDGEFDELRCWNEQRRI